jgi:N-acetylglutamate synthase-like GNAT family acetyltransferase
VERWRRNWRERGQEGVRSKGSPGPLTHSKRSRDLSVLRTALEDENGTVGSWADVYLDAAQGIAQIEDVVTADTHVQRGYAQTILATALQHASDYDLVFLLADPDDWPHHWYIRRGFNPIGRFHIFTRREAES